MLMLAMRHAQAVQSLSDSQGLHSDWNSHLEKKCHMEQDDRHSQYLDRISKARAGQLDSRKEAIYPLGYESS